MRTALRVLAVGFWLLAFVMDTTQLSIFCAVSAMFLLMLAKDMKR